MEGFSLREIAAKMKSLYKSEIFNKDKLAAIIKRLVVEMFSFEMEEND